MSDKVVKRETEWLDVMYNSMGQFFVIEERITTTWQRPDDSTYITEEIVHHDFPGWDF